MSESNFGARPKSQRPFYKDPLAAVWMAKHFEMKIAQAVDEEKSYSITTLLCWASPTHSNLASKPEKLYVHPGSLRLLQPQVGDLMTNLGMAAWRVSDVQGDTILFHQGRAEFFGKTREMRIIQRDGIAFHWPEQEAA